MKNEILILKCNLKLVNNLSFVNVIVSSGYRLTGNKFIVQFNGSKGYLSNIEITCEGMQREPNNIIWIENLRTKRGSLKNKTLSIYHSEENGVRVSV